MLGYLCPHISKVSAWERTVEGIYGACFSFVGQRVDQEGKEDLRTLSGLGLNKIWIEYWHGRLLPIEIFSAK
jgi:hypothetical protein